MVWRWCSQEFATSNIDGIVLGIVGGPFNACGRHKHLGYSWNPMQDDRTSSQKRRFLCFKGIGSSLQLAVLPRLFRRMHNTIVSLLLIVFFSVTNVGAQKPSTPEERAKVVELARLLETDPLGKDSNTARQWFKDWIKQTRVRSIPSCSTFFEAEEKNRYSDELSQQFQISTAAFMIEHLESAEDPSARLLAGMDGMLKAYAKILQTEPKATSPFLNSLINLQKSNELANRVREIMVQCSDVPLSDKNPRLPTGEVVYAPIEVERLPYVPRFPFPQYVPKARQKRTKGEVSLHVILGPTGTVTDVEVIKGLSDGLTESSVAAARTIKIEPALVGGKPVSIMLKVDYRFVIE
jgi:TonB family protein